MTNVHLQESEVDKEKLFEEVVETLTKALRDTTHEIEGAPMVQIMREDGEYRNLAIHAPQELFFKDVRVGKSGKIIFSFTAVDDVPWKWCEFDAAKLDKAVPLFGGQLREKLGYDGMTESLPAVLQHFIQETEKTMLKREEEAKVEAATAYVNNSKFGLF